MHLKVFVKLKKNLKTLSSGQKKTKKPTGLVFFFKTQVFSNPDDIGQWYKCISQFTRFFPFPLLRKPCGMPHVMSCQIVIFSHACEQAHRSRSCRQGEKMSGSSSAVLRWAFAPSSFSYPEAWKMRKKFMSGFLEVSDILHGLSESFSEERRHGH